MIRVVVAASAAVVRAGLEAMIAESPRLEVVGRAPSVRALGERIATLQPNVVLLELGQHDDDLVPTLLGLSEAADGAQRVPGIVVLSDDPGRAWTSSMLRSGVRGLLPRTASSEEVVAAVEAAAAGLLVVHPDAAESFLPIPGPSAPGRPSPATGSDTLTPREVEVLGMLAEGVGNKSIARRLRISEHTVKFHVGSILAKLNAASRTEAVTLGARRGLILL